MSPSGKAQDFDSCIRRSESGHPSQHKEHPYGCSLCWLGCIDLPGICNANASVRIRRPKIGELSLQAQGVRIFATGEYPAGIVGKDATTRKTALLQDAEPKSGDFERFLLPQSVKADWGYFLTLKFFEIL